MGLQKALSLQHPEVTQVFTEQLLELHRGQGMDIYWRDAHKCPTEDEYKTMVIRSKYCLILYKLFKDTSLVATAKLDVNFFLVISETGGLFGLAVRLMQLFSKNKS